MKLIAVRFLLLCAVIVSFGAAQYEPPKPRVIFYATRGFEVSIPHAEGISLFAFHGKRNVELEGTEPGTWNADIRKAINGRLVFVEPNVKFNLGDRLHYWISVHYNGLGYDSLYLMEEVKHFGVPSSGVTSEPTTYEFPQARINFLKPVGIEVSLPAEAGMTLMAFHGQINQEFAGLEGGVFSRDVTRPENGLFIYRDRNIRLKRGDKLHYWIHVIYKGLGYNLLDQVYTYRGDELNEDPAFVFPDSEITIDPRTTTTTDTYNYEKMDSSSRCTRSITQVLGQVNICAHQVVFEETFKGNQLNESRWFMDRRMADMPDFEFVLYSHEPLSIVNQRLRIEAQLFSDVYQQTLVSTKIFDVHQCTGRLGSPECEYRRVSTNDFIRPVVSSRISTVNSFSFLYGRIEVRAKLPRGHWIYPQILLEPKAPKYQNDYLQMRIAFIRNNPSFYDVEITQGVILDVSEPKRSEYSSKKLLSELSRNWDKEFHTYVIEWRPEGIKSFIDSDGFTIPSWRSDETVPGANYWLNSRTPAAPFDQECFITLGLGVGGIHEFVKDIPWENSSPKLIREFISKKESWYNSWTTDARALEVDWIKVIAL